MKYYIMRFINAYDETIVDIIAKLLAVFIR